MTKAELEKVQRICHDWLRLADTANGSQLTIAAGDELARAFELKISGLLTFDNVLILSANDAQTGACYVKLIRQPAGLEEVFDTPFEKLGVSVSAAEPALLRATQQRYQDARARIINEQVSVSVDDLNPAWIEKSHSPSEEPPKYLLYSKGKLLGYSLLERARTEGQRSGRFHPSEDYFEYAEIFAAFPDVENECLENSVRAAYGLSESDDGARTRFDELSAQIETLALYLQDESKRRLQTADLRLEDLSQKYKDQTERWLYVTIVS